MDIMDVVLTNFSVQKPLVQLNGFTLASAIKNLDRLVSGFNLRLTIASRQTTCSKSPKRSNAIETISEM